MTKSYSINTPKAISELLDGETIIIHLETGCYYSINKDGSTIWQTILDHKAIDQDTLSPEIKSFIEFLITEDLVREIDSTSDTVSLAENLDPKIDRYTDMQEMLLADPIHDVSDAGWPSLKKEA